MNLSQFHFYKKEEVLALTRLRKFETRLGEVVQTMQPDLTLQKELDQSTAQYVVFGIHEHIGAQANLEQRSASHSWNSFVSAFLNRQSNDFLEGEEVLLLGYFDFTAAEQLVADMAHDEEERTAAYRHAVNTIDDAVEGLVKAIVVTGKIPVIVGGGHNNAYACIKGAAKGLQQQGHLPIPQINAINLSTHSGYSPEEGRHAGNPYRYAEEDGFLEKYCIVGMEEGCLPQNVWMDIVNNPFMDCITYEDVFVRCKRSFSQAVEHAIGFTDDSYVGIDLNLCILERPGVTANGCSTVPDRLLRQYVTSAGMAARPAYLFLSGGTDADGGVLTHLVVDFIKAMEEVSD